MATRMAALTVHLQCTGKAARMRISTSNAPSQLWIARFQRPFCRAIQTQGPARALDPGPASSQEISPPNPARRPRRLGRKILFWTGASIAVCYLVDRYYCASSTMRSLRCYGVIALVTVDYKLNFKAKPLFGGTVEELHRRNAQRVCDLLQTNGGLYLKIGQAIAMQGAILPEEFQKMFANTFDNASQDDWSDVERVVREDFGGRSVEEVFGVSFSAEPGKGVIERDARASASIAQVHWARLADGREVAIKVQKRSIAKQVWWDLWAFRLTMDYTAYVTGLPIKGIGTYVTERLMLETDFVNEANNSNKMAALVESEPRLRGRVYIPRIYPELSSKRVMTAEWVEGVKLWDKEKLTAPWLDGHSEGSPRMDRSSLGSAPVPKQTVVSDTRDKVPIDPTKTHSEGLVCAEGLGVSLTEVMTIMIDLFSAQLFIWGFVHCDPHPGNIFIRRLPSGSPQLVLIDHGLYITLNPTFRRQYSQFWKAILSFDDATLSEVTKAWGLKSPEPVASAALMRPYKDRKASADPAAANSQPEPPRKRETKAETQERLIKEVGNVIGEENLWPRELIFIERNMGIVQGNNRFLGSPVNRMKLTGLWASRALLEDERHRPDVGVVQRTRNALQHVLFHLVLLGTDVVFYTSKLRQWAGLGGGMEQDIKEAEEKQLEQMKLMVKDVFQVEL